MWRQNRSSRDYDRRAYRARARDRPVHGVISFSRKILYFAKNKKKKKRNPHCIRTHDRPSYGAGALTIAPRDSCWRRDRRAGSTLGALRGTSLRRQKRSSRDCGRRANRARVRDRRDRPVNGVISYGRKICYFAKNQKRKKRETPTVFEPMTVRATERAR